MRLLNCVTVKADVDGIVIAVVLSPGV